MIIDRKIYIGCFIRDNIASWNCPTCNSGILTTLHANKHNHVKKLVQRINAKKGV